MRDEKELTQKRLKELLHYSPDTGVFTWLVTRGRYTKTGSVAGGWNGTGYRIISIDGKRYLAHRLAFMYIKGSFPKDQTDHINKVRHDNKWSNLRESTQRQNHENRRNNNKFIGVKWHKWGGLWEVTSPRVSGKQIWIGMFKTHLAACNARWQWDLDNQAPLDAVE